MQKLTKAEEQLMQVLWDLEKAFLKDIMEAYPEPKPKQSTVSTVIRILKEKGFIDHNTYGKTHEYFPSVSKEEYAKYYFGSFLSNYFDGSFKQLINFFHKEGQLDMKDLDEILEEED